MTAKSIVVGLAAILFVSVQPLSAQQGRNRDLGNLAPPDPQSTAYVSGAVLMAEGGTVPKETVVELICDGFPRATDHVSAKGEFDLELSGRGSGVADATRGSTQADSRTPQSSALGVVNMSGCIVRADLAGYQSTQIQLANRSMFDNPNIGEVTLSRLEGITGYAISPTVSAAPKKAAKSYEWAVKEAMKPKSNLKKMAERLESAVAEDPGFAAAWDLLGQVRLGLNQNEQAIAGFKQAVAGDPDFYPVYSRLVPLLARSGDMAGTIELGTKAIALNAHLDEVRFFLAGAQLRSGENEACINTALEMVAREAVTEYPQAYQFLGAAYANTGDFVSSAKYFRAFLKASPQATATNPIQKQLDEWVKNGVVQPASDAP
jgi:hypothetical protein